MILAGHLPASAAAAGAASGKPNVIVFLIDDLGRSDLAVDGSTFHHTPHLDALAASGIRFTDFYSAHPVCSPTRAALMTGKVPQRVGITDYIKSNSGVALPKEEKTLGEAFAARGYETAYMGKWHLGETDDDHPSQHGFAWTRGVNRAGQPSSYYYPYRRPKGNRTPSDVPDLEQGKEGDYLTDSLTTEAVAYLKQRDASRPFFLCFAHYAVHTPIEPPAGLSEKYQTRAGQLFGAEEAPTLPAPNGASSRARQDNPDYAAMVENLDANIGRVLQTLEDLKLRESTIIVFTSDNGGLCTLAKGRKGSTGPTCNLPWRSGKGWMYEGGIRTPCFISWPGTLPPATMAVPAYTPDLYPTLLELCGLPLLPEQHVDGRSLAASLRGVREPLSPRTLAWYYPHDHGSGHRPSAALRKGAWKLIHFFHNGQNELYDLDRDPGETRNLASDHPEETRALHQELMAWVASTNSKAPSVSKAAAAAAAAAAPAPAR